MWFLSLFLVMANASTLQAIRPLSTAKKPIAKFEAVLIDVLSKAVIAEFRGKLGDCSGCARGVKVENTADFILAGDKKPFTLRAVLGPNTKSENCDTAQFKDKMSCRLITEKQGYDLSIKLLPL